MSASTTKPVMSLSDSISSCIREVCEKYSLNATQITCNSEHVKWISSCGPIGEMTFTVPMELFTISIERGVMDVSTLISFATLTAKPENRGLADNILHAKYRGAPYYFQISKTANVMNVFVKTHEPDAFDWTIVYMGFLFDETTGEYTWSLPEEEELFADVNDTGYTGPTQLVGSDGLDAPQLVRSGALSIHSAYETLGLGITQSIGLPLRATSDAIRLTSGTEPVITHITREVTEYI